MPAATDATLLSLEREDFLAAVAGTTDAAQAADKVVGERLAAAGPATA